MADADSGAGGSAARGRGSSSSSISSSARPSLERGRAKRFSYDHEPCPVQSRPSDSEIVESMQKSMQRKDDEIRHLMEELERARQRSSQNSMGSDELRGAKIRDSEISTEGEVQEKEEEERRHKRGKRHKKRTKKKEVKRTAIESFMAKVKRGESTAENWEQLVRAMSGENHQVLNFKDKFADDKVNNEGDPTAQHETIQSVDKGSEDMGGKNTTGASLSLDENLDWGVCILPKAGKIEIEGLRGEEKLPSRRLNNEKRGEPSTLDETGQIQPSHKAEGDSHWGNEEIGPRDHFAGDESPSTALLINRMEQLSTGGEDKWEEGEDYDQGEGGYVIPSNLAEEENFQPRALFAKAGSSPSTAMLVSQMEMLSMDLLAEVDKFDSEDEDDFEPPPPCTENMKGQCRRNTILILKQLEDLSIELAGEVDDLPDEAGAATAEVDGLGGEQNDMGRSEEEESQRTTVALFEDMEGLGHVLTPPSKLKDFIEEDEDEG